LKRLISHACSRYRQKRYVYSDWKETKVASNYHVEYDGYFYSVHYSYANRPCSVRATSKTIEVYVDCERVAAHQRNYNPHERYTTLEEHMPDEHKAVYGWSTERFLLWADNIGLNTRELIQRVLKSSKHPVQSYRACMGIMRLCKNYPAEIMETASREALDKNVCSLIYGTGGINKETITRYGYDLQGNLAYEIAPNGNVTRYQYDELEDL